MLFYSIYGAGFGLNAILGAHVGSGVYVGGELGVGFLGDTSTITVTATDYTINSINNTGATLIPIMPTVFYRSPFGETGKVKGYIGLSTGPAIHVQSLPSSTATSTTTTHIYFEFLVKPGVELSLSKQVGLLLETRFGVLRTGFLFSPQLSVTIGF
jgi:hypothetical protein